MPVESSITIEPISNHPGALGIAAKWVSEQWGSHTHAETVEFLDDPDDCPPTLIAIDGDQPVGVISFSRFLRDGDDRLTLFINSLYVLETGRSGGVGSRLLSAAVESAREWVDVLYVYTDIWIWYENRGWSVIDSDNGHATLRLVMVEDA